MSDDVVIISMNEKGFPQADRYIDGQHFTESDWDGASPDWFCTGSTGQRLSDFKANMMERLPEAQFIDGAEPD